MISRENRPEQAKKWFDNGGVLLISYELFKRLVEASTLEIPYIKYLQNPGPDLVIVDEAHKIKNSSTMISNALKAIKTNLRLCLTGYPIQNNMDEYWCMLDFARPYLLGNIFIAPPTFFQNKSQII